jgi:hypothetical protein
MLVASEVELRDLETVYSLRINRKHVGDVSIFPNYALSFGIIGIKCSRAQILIWDGTRFWLVDLHTSELRAGQSTYDEIHGAFPLNGSWILVGETTLMTLDASTATLSTVHTHSAVIVEAWWEGSVLRFNDWQDRISSSEPVANPWHGPLG